jgi:hypothetical protein
VQGRKRQLGLGLDAVSLQDAHVARTLPRVPQQGALTDPRFAANHQRPAARGARTFQQRPDLGTLSVPAVQHRPIVRLDAQPGDLADAT